MDVMIPAKDRFHPTWWMLATTVISAAAMFLVSPDRNIAIPLLLIPIVLSYVVRWRLPGGGVFPWLVRGFAFAAIIMTAPESGPVRAWYVDPAMMCLIGTLLEAELAVEHFLPIDGRVRIGQLLCLTSGIVLAGSVGEKAKLISALAPAYTICVLGVLGGLGPKWTGSPAQNSRPPRRMGRRWLLKGMALVMALTLGFGTSAFMRWVYFGMSGVGTRFLQNLISISTAGGMSGNESLRGTYNPTSSTGRNLKIYGTNQMMYLRGLAFDRYENGKWLPQFERRTWSPAGQFQLPPDAHQAMEIERLTDSLGILYLPINSAGFATPPHTTNQQEPAPLSAVQSVSEKGDTLRYRVVLPKDGVQGPLCAPPTQEQRQLLLKVSDSLEPGVRALAESVRGPTPMTTIGNVVKHMEENHHYSLKSDFASERDPVSYFLLAKKDAHCQFFASGAAMLLRMNGIPCRYVTGYLAHELAGKNSMVVRGRDAHAWVEAYLEGVGWVTVEATPGNGTPPGFAESVGWYQKIKDILADVGSAFGDFVRSLSFMHVALAGGAVLGFALLMQWIKNWRLRRKRPKIRLYAVPDEEYRRMAIEFEQALKLMGEGPSGAATWSEYLEAVGAQTHRTGRQLKLEKAGRFVAAYNRTRFGRPDDRASILELRQLLEELKESR